ncbi:hypothetical protein E4V51_06975, partial [Paenibacillus sp. 28ISP30-2]|nr:hypothetical protein [Paenibacillus sp. 28ISP30-2]
ALYTALACCFFFFPANGRTTTSLTLLDFRPFPFPSPCRVRSNFTIDAQRQQASTHSVTLTVIDPERFDNKLGTIKRYEIATTSANN